MSQVTKVVDYAAERANVHKLITPTKKAAEEVYTSPFATTGKIGETAKKVVEDTVHPDAAAYQAHYAPYINGKTTGEDVVQKLTDPRPNA